MVTKGIRPGLLISQLAFDTLTLPCYNQPIVAECYSSIYSSQRTDTTFLEMGFRRGLMIVAHIEEVRMVVSCQGKAILRRPSIRSEPHQH